MTPENKKLLDRHCAEMDAEELNETIAEWRDRLINLYAASELNVPAHIHAQCLADGIMDICNQMTMHLAVNGYTVDQETCEAVKYEPS